MTFCCCCCCCCCCFFIYQFSLLLLLCLLCKKTNLGLIIINNNNQIIKSNLVFSFSPFLTSFLFHDNRAKDLPLHHLNQFSSVSTRFCPFSRETKEKNNNKKRKEKRTQRRFRLLATVLYSLRHYSTTTQTLAWVNLSLLFFVIFSSRQQLPQIPFCFVLFCFFGFSFFPSFDLRSSSFPFLHAQRYSLRFVNKKTTKTMKRRSKTIFPICRFSFSCDDLVVLALFFIGFLACSSFLPRIPSALGSTINTLADQVNPQGEFFFFFFFFKHHKLWQTLSAKTDLKPGEFTHFIQQEDGSPGPNRNYNKQTVSRTTYLFSLERKKLTAYSTELKDRSWRTTLYWSCTFTVTNGLKDN